MNQSELRPAAAVAIAGGILAIAAAGFVVYRLVMMAASALGWEWPQL